MPEKPYIESDILYTPSGAGISISGLLAKAEKRAEPAFCEPPSDRELIYLLKCAVEALRDKA